MNEKLVRIQEELASKLLIPEKNRTILPDKTSVLALDIQYSAQKAYIGAVYQAAASPTWQVFQGMFPAAWDYQPGFFAFREGIPLYNMISHVLKQTNCKPNLLLLDSHGIAHPRKMGLATWLGLFLGLPSVGCAKKSLLPYDEEYLGQEAASAVPIILNQEVLGYALRRKASVKPVFVSPGYKVHPVAAREWVMQLKGAYRIPDIQREADQAARRYAQGEFNKEDIDLSPIPAYMNPDDF